MAPTAMTVAGIVGGVAGTALLAWPIAIWCATHTPTNPTGAWFGCPLTPCSSEAMDACCRLEVRRCEKPTYVLLKRLKEAGW